MSAAPAVRVIPPGVSGKDLEDGPEARKRRDWRRFVNQKGGAKRAARKCSKCGELGHTAPRCAKGGGGASMRTRIIPPEEIVLRIRVVVSVERAGARP